MSRPKQDVIKALRGGLANDSGFLVAVSGGIDSMSLLHGVLSLCEEKSLALEIAHVDHGIRPTSGEDAAFVKEFAEQHQVPFHLRCLEGPPEDVNVENWARKVRYEFFGELLETCQLDYVLTAHNANDVAETLLMRLLSNKEPKSILFKDEQRKCLRPLLTVTRGEIEAYAKEHDLPFRDDETNLDSSYLRNRVRNILIPSLEEDYDRRIVETLAKRASFLAEDFEALYDIAEHRRQALLDYEWGSKEWVLKAKVLIISCPPGIKWRVAELLLKEKLFFNVGRTKAREFVLLLLAEIKGVELPGSKSVRRSGGCLEFS